MQDTQHDNVEKRGTETLLNRMEERISNVEAEIKKITAGINKILRCVQDHRSAVRKPDGLSITSMEQMQEFEESVEQHYTDVVNYFHYIGGFTLKEATNLCLKEALHDTLVLSYTWFGRDEGRQPLYNTRLVKAIYDAVCRNNSFAKPQKSEFQKEMRNSLRVMKERNQIRMKRHQRNPVPLDAEHLWDDEEEDNQDCQQH
ncbi:uncharacterized protein LOC116851852 [Odontomachus brunneus]|uniref:uncharacterized protein LOC116851852 n=1 Tax=Odontomachus brunneus TaxID=486640 RepID=UPI0013F288CC|nr:uncharacterized protein LOC116851852 [Odontomachus brunneus]